MSQQEENIEVKAQSVSAIGLFVIQQAAKAVIGFVTLYFFKPVWEKFIEWREKRRSS